MTRPLDQNLTVAEIQDMTDAVSAYSSGTIQFPEFLNLMARPMEAAYTKEKLKEAIQNIDMDGNGFISASELFHVMAVVGQEVTDEEVDDIIRAVDMDGYSQIRYDQFAEAMLIPSEDSLLRNSTRFTWKMEDFSKLKEKKTYSDIFYTGSYKWRIMIFPKGNNVDFLSIYLDVADSASLPDGWSRDARFSMRLINRIVVNRTRIKERQHKFNARESSWGFTSYILLKELHDPNGGYIVNDTCIIEAEVDVSVMGNIKTERVTHTELRPNFEIQPVEDSPSHGTNSRTSSISPPPANVQKPTSTLRNRSNIASTMLRVFMSEFDSDIPTYEKFGKVMEDLRASMYGGNMGDIFEEWRPRILEIEALLGDIEDLEQEREENQEAFLQQALSRTIVSLAQFGEKSIQAEEKIIGSLSLVDSKRQELHSIQQKLTELRSQMSMLLMSEKKVKDDLSAQEYVHAKATSEKEEADKEIKKLDQRKEDVTKNIGDVQARAEVRRIVLAEKKAAVQEWLSNPLPPPGNT